MSSQDQLIVCRRCNETIPQEEGSCPHCGTSIRGNVAYIGTVVFGLLLAVMTVLAPGELLAFGLLGVLMTAIAGYLFYNKRQRIRQASQESDSTV